MPLNPRQLSLAIWLCVLLAFCLVKRDIRHSVISLVACGLHPILLVPAILSLAWITAVVLGLNRLGFWTFSLLWDTLAFALVGTTVLVWRMGESKDYSRRFYGRIIWRSLGLSVLIAAVGNTYTFNIVVELVLVPWLVLLGAMLGLAQASDEYSNMRKPLQFLVTLTGLAMLTRAVAGAISDYDGFLRVETVQSLLLLFALTAAYVPYLFLVRVWMTYQSALIPLRLGDKKSLRVCLYTRARIVIKFGLNLARVEKFGVSAAHGLSECTTRASVDAVFKGREAST